MDRVSLQGLGSRPRGFARLVARAYVTPPQERDANANSPVEYWLAQAEAMLVRDQDRGATATFKELGEASDIELERGFTACARLLYALRVRLPAEAEYQRRGAADPAFAAVMDGKAKEIFERLNAFKLEIMNRRRIDNAEEQKEADEVWDKLRRDLRLGDEAQPDSEEALSVSEEHGQGLEHYLQAAENTHPALASSPSRNEPRIIPDEPPSPRSYWIDLFPVERYGRAVPETAPEPPSLFLELRRLDDSASSSALEVPPSPTGVTLELHEFRD